MKSFALIVTVLIAGAAHAGQEAAPQPAQAAPATSQRVLPLDHGPRAQSTPWLNQQTRQREAKAAAAAAATAKAPAKQPAAGV